ncbi:diguanylate cyclase [Modicisalibacter tunisiensis]|uniref:sensor domain-containing diguanylate cyclase n=1 Tax=Modicisalibacter tunisiensis TaxID=390637 RepID=UPI001CCB6AB3|nr:diguanylate cyclase [Modicisalibacter tunisiensis]MBZ9539398.1 diguanylate cyclase [Modicisalibacter tunisiensis]
MPDKEWFKRVMEDSEDAYIFVSRDNIIEDVAGAVREVLKRSRQELVGARLCDRDVLREDFLERYRRAMEGEKEPGGDREGIYLDRRNRLRWKCYETNRGYIVARVSRFNADLEAEEVIVDQLADALPMMVAYVDRQWRFLFNNKAYEDFVGLSRKVLYRQPVSSVVDGESFQKLIPRFRRVLSGKRVDYEDQLTLVDGRRIYIRVSYIPDYIGDEVVGFYAVITDVSEYNALISLLKDIHAGVNRTDISSREMVNNLLRDSLDYLSQDVAIVSHVEGEQYTVIWSEAREEGVAPGTTFPLGDTYCRLALDEDDVFHTVNAGSDARFKGHPCYEKFGLETYIGAPVTVDGKVWGTVNFSSSRSRSRPFTEMEVELVRLVVSAVSRIVTHAEYLEKIQKERDEMTAQARKDQLTGLPNRAYLHEYVGALMSSPDVGNRGVCLAVIDIDHFKSINDNYGHDVGDQVIVWLSNTVSVVLRAREGDFAARIGGEEFVVMINNASLDVAGHVMERVRERVASLPVPVDGREPLHITISSGVTRWQLADTYPQVFKRADQALYEAKHGGRNRVCLKA